MHFEALEKAISIARKNPRILLSPTFYEKLCTRLDIITHQTQDTMTLVLNGKQIDMVVVNHENCDKYKCAMREGKTGIRIFEFINALVILLADQEVPSSPYEKMGQTADYYCERGIKILEDKFQNEVSDKPV